MTIVSNATGQIVRRSKNLRGFLDHARRVVPVSVTVTDTDGRFLTEAQAGQPVRRYEMRVTFQNGDTAVSYWADWRVAADWIEARRSWRGVELAGLLAPC